MYISKGLSLEDDKLQNTHVASRPHEIQIDIPMQWTIGA
jgi:hypothetical protein